MSKYTNSYYTDNYYTTVGEVFDVTIESFLQKQDLNKNLIVRYISTILFSLSQDQSIQGQSTVRRLEINIDHLYNKQTVDSQDIFRRLGLHLNNLAQGQVLSFANTWRVVKINLEALEQGQNLCTVDLVKKVSAQIDNLVQGQSLSLSFFDFLGKCIFLFFEKTSFFNIDLAARTTIDMGYSPYKKIIIDALFKKNKVSFLPEMPIGIEGQHEKPINIGTTFKSGVGTVFSAYKNINIEFKPGEHE